MNEGKYDAVANDLAKDESFDRFDVKNLASWGFLFFSILFALVAVGGGLDDCPWSKLKSTSLSAVPYASYEFGLLEYTNCLGDVDDISSTEDETTDCPTAEYSDECLNLLKVCNPLDGCEGAGKGTVVLVVFAAAFSFIAIILAMALQKWPAYVMANLGANLYFAGCMLWWAGCHQELEKNWMEDVNLTTGWILCLFSFIFAFIAGALLCEWKPKHVEADPDIAELNEMHRDEDQAIGYNHRASGMM